MPHRRSRICKPRVAAVAISLAIISIILGSFLWYQRASESKSLLEIRHGPPILTKNLTASDAREHDHYLQRRIPSVAPLISEAVYQNYIRKGRENLQMLADTTTIATGFGFTPVGAPHAFNSYNDLTSHGWKKQPPLPDEVWEAQIAPFRHLESRLMREWPHGIGISLRGEYPGEPVLSREDLRISKALNTLLGWEYDRKPTIDGKETSIRGFYGSIYSPNDGILISLMSYSPWRFKPAGSSDVGWPALHHWSDVMYLEWQHQCETGNYLSPTEDNRVICRRGPRFIVKSAIKNDEVIQLLLEISRRIGILPHGRLPVFNSKYVFEPGYDHHRVDADGSHANCLRDPAWTEYYIAVLGSVLGSSVAHFYADHAHQMGDKFIKEIWVYSHQDPQTRKSKSRVRPTIVFVVENVQEHDDQGTGDQEQGGGAGDLGIQDGEGGQEGGQGDQGGQPGQPGQPGQSGHAAPGAPGALPMHPAAQYGGQQK